MWVLYLRFPGRFPQRFPRMTKREGWVCGLAGLFDPGDAALTRTAGSRRRRRKIRCLKGRLFLCRWLGDGSLECRGLLG